MPATSLCERYDWRYNMLVFKINLKNSATPQVHIYRYNLFTLAYFPNPISAHSIMLNEY